MSAPYSTEKQIAIAAVRRACGLTTSIFNKIVKQETVTKEDSSPVTGTSSPPPRSDVRDDEFWGCAVWAARTVGDYSAQAVVNTILNRMFPEDPIVGEEDAADLRRDEGTAVRERIIQLANETLTAPLVPGEEGAWGLGPSHGRTTEQLLDAIDRGAYNGGRSGRECLFT